MVIPCLLLPGSVLSLLQLGVLLGQRGGGLSGSGVLHKAVYHLVPGLLVPLGPLAVCVLGSMTFSLSHNMSPCIFFKGLSSFWGSA